MKKTRRILAFASIVPIMLLASCNQGKTSSNTGNSNSGHNSSHVVHDSTFTVSFRGHVYEEDAEGLALTVGEQDAALVPSMIDTTVTGSFTYASSDESVVSVSATGKLSALKAGSASVTVSLASDSNSKLVLGFTVTDSSTANGGYSFATQSYDEKANILGALEKYAVDNYLTGITIFSNGSQVCYNSRYVPQPKSYISGYGWGTTREGVLNGPLTKSISGKPTYYNIATTSLPTHANAMNASGSDVSSVYDYIANAYFATRMNATNDGYEWYPSLSTDDAPIAVEEPTTNADGSVKTPGAEIASSDARYNYNKRWRIHLRTGDKAPVYRSNSSVAESKKYDGQKVVLDDYLTPIKMMLTAWNAQYRGAEMTTGTSGFEGAASYYNKTASNNTGDSTALWNDTEWNKDMGSNIYTGHDDKGDFIEFNLLSPCTTFYAMYQLSSSLYSPLPESFIKYWTPATLGKSRGSDIKPTDTMLSTGPYYIEDWNAQVVNFKKNDQYFHQTDTLTQVVNGQTETTTRKVYQIAGISYYWVSETSEAKNHFLAGETDSYAPNKDDLKSDFSADSGTSNQGASWRKYKTLGDSNFKLNVNASTQDQWLNRFGPTGTIYQHGASVTSTNNWMKTYDDATTAVKPYMSNIHFLNFLSYSINRQEICESRGMTPTQDYFSDNYLIDPETGVSYNSTDAHKAVLADRYPETYGYNLTAARDELVKAIDQVLLPMAEKKQFKSKNSGAGAGSSTNPWIVPIDMEWMNTNDKSDYSDVFTYVKQVFQQVSDEDYNGMFELDLHETGGNADYNEVYNLMRRGEFDLGFGSISGNALDPINFLEVLKSDNSSGFTLNWGADTATLGSGLYSAANGDDESKNYVTYDGKRWSYDGLWKAATIGVVLGNDGSVANVKNVSTRSAGATVYKYDAVSDTDQSVTYRLSFETLLQGGATKINIALSNNSAAKATFDVSAFAASSDQTITATGGYATLKKTDTDHVYTLTISKDFNTAVAQDTTSGKVAAGSDVNTVLLTLTYHATLNDANTALSSTLTLLTYKGVKATSK